MAMRSKLRAAPAPDPEPFPPPSLPPPDEDPLIIEQVDRAVAPFAPLLSPEGLASMREYLTDFAASHPTMRRLFERLRRPGMAASGERAKDE
jgi:hypothetical protein